MKTFYLSRLMSLLLLLTTCWRTYAQPPKLRFEHLTIADGLSANGALCLLQDQKGYLWFATNNGLDKYDGYSFKTYKMNPRDSTSLVQNATTALWEDKDGLIWIGTVESGISKFDPTTEKFTHYLPPHPKNTFTPALKSISTINSDKEGMLWIGTWTGELRRFNKLTGKYSEVYFLEHPPAEKDDITPDYAIMCMFKDRSGNLWFGGKTGLHQLILSPGKPGAASGISFKHYHHDPANPNSISHNWVSSIYQDHTGTLWAGTLEGLNRFDPQTGVFTHYRNSPKNLNSLSSDIIPTNSIAEDLAGNLWVGTDNGLNRLDRERTQITRFLHDAADPASLSNNSIIPLMVDRSGILWVGTFESGINKLDPYQKPFTLYRHNPLYSNSLSNNIVSTICEDKEGVVWIGTRGGGLNALNRKTGKFTHYRHNPNNSKSLPSDYVQAILQDRNGRLWIASPEKISHLNIKTGEFTHYSTDVPGSFYLADNFNFTLYEDLEGVLWLGTRNGIKGFDSRTGKIKYHYWHDPKNPKGISDYEVYAVLKDSRGNLWSGHGSVGLSRLDAKKGKFKHYLPNRSDSTSVSSSIVYCIYEDSKGNLWFGTKGGGLCKFDYEQETFTTYTEKHGLANNTVYSIQEDNAGNLWLGTAKGLSRFSLAQQTFTNYEVSDGLQSNAFSPQAATKGRDGTLYFGGINGFNAFNPELIKPNTYVPPVVITQVKVFDKLLPGKHQAPEIELRHRENFFSFELATLNYTNSQKNQYAYKLEGVNPDWVYSGTQRYASYTNIAPGTYIFRVKASNNDGIWNEQGTSIRIIIHPPWWGTWWFYVLGSLAAGSLIYLFIRSYIHRKLEKQRLHLEKKQAIEMERLRISSELHDDVGGELSTIRLLSEMAVSNTNHQQQLSQISASSGELVQKMNEIVWALNVNNDTLQSLLAYIRRFALKYLDDVGIDCHFELPVEIPEYAVDGTTRRQVFLLVKEALHNVVKHARATRVYISISLNNYLLIAIHDNGKGIPEEKLTAGLGNGLYTMHKRTQDLQGELHIINQDGTTLNFRVPLTEIHTKV